MTKRGLDFSMKLCSLFAGTVLMQSTDKTYLNKHDFENQVISETIRISYTYRM